MRNLSSFLVGATALVFALSLPSPTLSQTADFKRRSISPLPVLPVRDTAPRDLLLTWTAPGDDGVVGQAAEYDLRYATAPIDEANFGSAARLAGLPAPQPAGLRESFLVTGLPSDQTLYFALRTGDENGNWSGLSNVVSLPPLEGTVSPPPTPSPITIGTGPPDEELTVYPNPAPGNCTIRYALPAPGEDSAVQIVDVSGRRIRRLRPRPGETRIHRIVWDGRDENGVRVPSGVYLFRVGARSGRILLCR
jgi:hypothetical protein